MTLNSICQINPNTDNVLEIRSIPSWQLTCRKVRLWSFNRYSCRICLTHHYLDLPYEKGEKQSVIYSKKPTYQIGIVAMEGFRCTENHAIGKSTAPMCVRFALQHTQRTSKSLGILLFSESILIETENKKWPCII